MKKAIVAGSMAVVLACSLGLAGCSDGTTVATGSDEEYYQLSDSERQALYGTEIEGSAEVDFWPAEGSFEEYDSLDFTVFFDYESESGEGGLAYFGIEYSLEGEDGYDSVYDYADDETEVTYTDGTEASFADLENGMSVTAAIDDEGVFRSIVINE